SRRAERRSPVGERPFGKGGRSGSRSSSIRRHAARRGGFYGSDPNKEPFPMRIILAASFTLASLVACSGPDSSIAPASARVASTDSTSAAMTAGNPAEVLTRGGTFWFSFDESPKVLAMMKDRCAQKEHD